MINVSIILQQCIMYSAFVPRVDIHIILDLMFLIKINCTLFHTETRIPQISDYKVFWKWYRLLRIIFVDPIQERKWWIYYIYMHFFYFSFSLWKQSGRCIVIVTSPLSTKELGAKKCRIQTYKALIRWLFFKCNDNNFFQRVKTSWIGVLISKSN